MGDVTLLGVLRMPISDNPDPLVLRQFVDRARQAADRIESDAAELARFRAELASVTAELSGAHQTIIRQGDLLRAAINVLRGPPPEDVHWSVHDVAEHAERVVAERDALRADAERYRWLCSPAVYWVSIQTEPHGTFIYSGPSTAIRARLDADIDTAIDAARATGGGA